MDYCADSCDEQFLYLPLLLSPLIVASYETSCAISAPTGNAAVGGSSEECRLRAENRDGKCFNSVEWSQWKA